MNVNVYVKDHYETRELTYLSSQMKEEIINRAMDNIRGWQRIFGKKIENTGIGGIIDALKHKAYLAFLDNDLCNLISFLDFWK